MKVVDFHDIRAPGFPGGVLRYEIAAADGRWYWRRAEPGWPWAGGLDTYDGALSAVRAIEDAAA